MKELMSREVDQLGRKGHQLYKDGQIEAAIKTWREALDLIPEPKQEYFETRRFLLAMGDAYFGKRMYSEACECFYKIHGPQSLDDGSFYTVLRLGECYFELGDEENAKQYLIKAYMLGGKAIFEPEDGMEDGRKYYDFLKANVGNMEFE